MEELMTSLAALGIVGSFLGAGVMAWSVPPPVRREPIHGPVNDRRRW